MHKVNRLKYLRLKNGVTVSQLSRDTGVSKTIIGVYESGRSKRGILFKRALAFSQYFNVTIYELIGLNQTIEIVDSEYQELFPIVEEVKESPLINLFITQPRRSLKDTLQYLQSRR